MNRGVDAATGLDVDARLSEELFVLRIIDALIVLRARGFARNVESGRS
jgi:hypothetical protein